MNKIYIAIMMTLLLLCGCTQNNGDIGPIYGSWALIGITEDGTAIAMEDETVFSFQNEIVQVIRLAEPPYSSEYKYGNFSVTDKVLTLKFQAHPTASGSYMYMTPTWLHFPEDGKPILFDIRKLEGGSMILDLSNDGKKYSYTLKRTW